MEKGGKRLLEETMPRTHGSPVNGQRRPDNSDTMLGESFDGLLLEVAGAEGDQRKGHTALGGESAGTVDVHNPAANAPFLVGHQTFEIRIGLIGIRERTCQPLGPEVQGRVAQRCAAICHAVSSGWSSLDRLSGARCQGRQDPGKQQELRADQRGQS